MCQNFMTFRSLMYNKYDSSSTILAIAKWLKEFKKKRYENIYTSKTFVLKFDVIALKIVISTKQKKP